MTGGVSFITGAGAGIGAAAARRLAGQGFKVALFDLDLGAAEKVAASIRETGGDAIASGGDVRKEADLAAALEQAVGAFGRITSVVASAGLNGVLTPIQQFDLTDWQTTIDTNLTGTFLTVKHAIPQLRAAKEGSIVLIGSVNGVHCFSSLAGMSAYAASKAAVAAFAKCAALELARWNIRVNVVLPGWIRTHISERTFPRQLEEIQYQVEVSKPFPPIGGRPGSPFEVADAIAFLVSEASRYVTGSELTVDGGWSLLRG